MISPGIQAVFFDAVGTLLHPEPVAPTVYTEIGKQFGSRYSAEAIAARFAAAFQREEDIDRLAGWQTSEVREYRRWRNIVFQVLDDVTDAEACFQELYHHFSRAEAWRDEAEVPSVLKALAERGY